MSGKELELIETLAAISRVSRDLALKLAVMMAKAESAGKNCCGNHRHNHNGCSRRRECRHDAE